MKKYIGWITSQPTTNEGKPVPAALVADLTPVIADNLDRARTAFTARIAKNDQLAHVLEQPTLFNISIQEVVPSMIF